MTSAVKIAYHISAFSWYAFIVNCLASKDGEDLPAGIFVYGGPWKYLTFLNLLLQMTLFGLAAVNDLQPGKQTESTLKKCNDFLFSVFGFPVGMFVVLLFWTIFAYDRELVYPASIDSFFPPWINHAMHTFVLPISLGEVLVQPHAYPQRKHALAALTVVGLAYLSWYCDLTKNINLLKSTSCSLFMSCRILWVYVSVGVWVYPLLGHFSPSGLAGFFFFNMSVVTLLYMLGEKLNNLAWSKKQLQSAGCQVPEAFKMLEVVRICIHQADGNDPRQ
ncbi:androgen-dependent TFPI-regulating protein [Oryzias melastigma]|uniref:androgen-dependent TFPI-regulating protein n=1 Tax=Oryzias melastigma TaxID=30732 RepID=UPI00168D750F|nr:androgen-dependent TFPI-regulating protein [Oryzias melastigma]